MSACLAEDDLLALARGGALDDAPGVEAHLADCPACSALLATLLDEPARWGELAGTALGPYRLDAQIGAGAMGAVYRAWDDRLHRHVAVKVHAAATPELARRFATEARAAASIQHPNVVTIHDVGTAGGIAYIALELVDGESLRSIIDRGPQPIDRVRRLVTELARGLAAAHAHGVVHRDLKPENLVITADGTLKILDFGLATLDRAEEVDTTQPGTLHGTIGYMAPEQARGEPADARADLFAVGAIAYELATGRRAFPGASHAERLSAILRDTPAIPAELGDLGKAIARCIDKDPQRRFQSAQDLAWLLERHDAPAPPSRRGFLAGTLAAGAAGVAGLVGGRWLWRRGDPPSAPAYRQLTYRLGRVMTARFTRDGWRLLYGAAWEGEPLAAFAIDLSGGGTRAFDVPGADVLAVSAREVAISIDRRFVHHQSATGRLATVPLVGGAPRMLLPDVQDADFAPDGETLAVARPGGRGFVLELGGRVLVDTDGWITHPRVSPDGTRVGFLLHPSVEDDRGDVVVVDTAGAQRTLSRDWSSIAGLAWDGDDLWFTAAREGAASAVRAIDAGGELRTIAETTGRLRLHDVVDRRAAVTVDTWRLRTFVNAGGSGEHERSLTEFSLVTDISSDGKTLLIGELGEALGMVGAFVLPLDGKPLRLGAGLPIALSPSGERVAIVTETGGFVVYSTRSADRPVIDTAGLDIGSGRWIDETSLVVRAGGKLWRLAIGKPPQELAEDGGKPELDAARRRCAFVDRTGMLRVVELATGTARTLGRFPDKVACGWSDDSVVLRTATTPIELTRVAPDGTATPWFAVAPPPIGLKAVDSFVIAGGTYAYSFGQELSQLFAMTFG